MNAIAHLARQGLQQPSRIIPYVAPCLTEPLHWRKMNRFVEVCGCGHTGTTLLIRMLGAHPLIFSPAGETGAFMQKLPWERLRQMRRDFLSSGKPVLAEKTPSHIRRMNRIRRIVPAVKFILTVRDGRDVAASYGKRFEDGYQRGLREWTQDTRIVASEASSLDVHVLRYEDLVENPTATLSKACEFIGVRFDAATLEYHTKKLTWDGRTGDLPGSGRNGEEHIKLRAWQVNQPIFDGRAQWKGKLSAEVENGFLKGDAGELMQRFGYTQASAA